MENMESTAPGRTREEGVRHEVSSSSKAMHASVAIYWVLPMLCIAAVSRLVVVKGPFVPPDQLRPTSVNLSNLGSQSASDGRSYASLEQDKKATATKSNEDNFTHETLTSFLSNKPVGYQDIVKTINRRRLDWSTASTEPTAKYKGGAHLANTSNGQRDHASVEPNNTSGKKDRFTVRGASTDPARTSMLSEIKQLRQTYTLDRSNVFNAVYLADALRTYDVQYHDGGTMQQEAISVYKHAIGLVERKRAHALQAGEKTNVPLTGVVDINEEILIDYTRKSLDGLLCSLYTSLGKVYFMANMFEKAVSSYSEALKIEPNYLDALSSRGSSLIILGKYNQAAADFLSVIEADTKRRFLDSFTGLARVLQAKEDASPTGWDPIVKTLDGLIPILEDQMQSLQKEEGRVLVENSLSRLHHVLFMYHDSKTNNVDSAWKSLTRAYSFKMKNLPTWRKGFEMQKIQATMQIFHEGFWPDVGSDHDSPIFIIGFVRCGSTLLERILDAHPEIVGTGENSVFNGQLDAIRNRIVQASMLGDPIALKEEVGILAQEVLDEMRERQDMLTSGEGQGLTSLKPRKYIDKMLTNYYNVGFIHMLFPKALILHVFREPMDTVFSAYKHDFPSGPLDYTSSFDSLAELYHGYRDLMEHWDTVLPGRIIHVKYEDMVKDTHGVSKAIVDATELDWHDDILHFHKKRQAVNTLSTTQVRKGIYTDSLQAWRKYGKYLHPLVKKIGDRVHFNLPTNIPNYSSQS